MAFEFEISDNLKIKLSKLLTRDKTLAIALNKKMKQIINCLPYEIDHFKNLKGNMKEYKRVHISSFVLTFKVLDNKIYFEDFDHHDKIYR